MATISIIEQPGQGASVFNPMFFEFAWEQTSVNVVNFNGNASILVPSEYNSILFVGDFVRILSGTYQGTYEILTKTQVGTEYRLELNTPFTANSLAVNFIPEISKDFQIITGYLNGTEASIKTWSVTSELRVNPNSQGVYRFDVSGFLKSRFEITEPLAGPNVPISLRYFVREKTNAQLPGVENSKTVYYGLQNLSIAQQDGSEAIGIRPILFFGNVPTLYSLAGNKGIVNNFISDPDAGQITTTQSIIDLNLLSCEPKEILWLGTGPTAGFTTDPALPDWIQATAEGDNISIIINPCTGGVGDYLADDYNPADYLTGGQLNSVTGCFSFDFSLSGTPLFTLNICVVPVSELINVCKEDVLNFAWLNELGGFSSFALESKYVKGREFGTDQTIVTSTKVLKRIEYDEVYDSYQLSGGVLSKQQLDLFLSMRSSIQVFLYNEDSQAWDIPVVINRGSVTTYGNRFNQSEIRFSFQFRVSQQVRIQTQ